ncbi:MAG: FKBP-type peptidyl-prolyl cis-trans isomerase [Pseudomonadota bacterium]
MKLNFRRNYIFSSLLIAAASTVAVSAFAQSELTTPEQKASYAIGANIGSGISTQGLAEDVDLDAIAMGMKDAVAGNLKLTPEEMEAVMQEFGAVMTAKQQAAMQEQAKAGVDFLAKNATAAGVKTTASGLQYLPITEASDASAPKPTAADSVSVHYHGTLIDGTVFDSSVERGEPISFPLNGVIAGWTEGLQLMNVGDKYRLFIPSELGYGEAGAGPIPPNSTLIFEVELLGIEPAAPAAQ